VTTAELTRKWTHDTETPDLIGILKAGEITLSANAVIPPLETPLPTQSQPDIEGVVEDFKKWLAADSLDWDAVERGDTWTD
jgi:hypothetical protein